MLKFYFCFWVNAFAVITLLLLVTTLLSGCNTTTQTPITVQQALQNSTQLATVQYTITKVVKANDNLTWYKLGNRKIVYSLTAYITAGINLSKLTTSNISIKNKSITVALPAAEIVSIDIPVSMVKEEVTEIGILRTPFTNTEKNELLLQGEQAIKQQITQLNILTIAKTNAEKMIENFLKNLGYSNVTIITSVNK